MKYNCGHSQNEKVRVQITRKIKYGREEIESNRMLFKKKKEHR